MATITAADIKRLRELTGAGMMDVKKALTEADGDFDAAVEALRIKGAKDVAKRAGRTSANGLVAQSGNALLELNCETDFVAKNGAFIELAQTLVEHAAATKPGSVEEFLASDLKGTSVADIVAAESAKIGEKLVVGKVANIEGDIAVYMHRKDPDLPPQVGVIVAFTGDADVARSVGMQIAAMRPKYLSKDEVPAETIEAERRVAEQTAREEGKPERAIEKITEGKVTAYYKDFVLLEQGSVSDDKKSVAKVLEEAGTTVTDFAHFEVGRE
ncbi:translation elongation factor Ts [Stackebrandtia nassauensis]|uniref:Elongation factor Ts n=1 Tax=Stackebrandtia nassauensis (strain DSM 44728 / CIP 108903 / NRRL B-16338 / NBRC 102104 / LLR-40K-21) TaxID=446470 RepID=D3Q223_STANL|nr:translation elongation factor Ts [Stackebrandtia nassauensis]ADD41890.1 translation elongation factor Ts [Stackebrandtia nassauensis DSM 44728]